VPAAAETDTIRRLLRRRAVMDADYIHHVDRMNAAHVEALSTLESAYASNAQAINDLIETLRDTALDRPVT
jgi:putative heme iron utilization protein